MPRLVYLNGDYIPEIDARISIFDSALMFGDMVFEMTRTFKQEPFRLENHIERLYASIQYAGIDCGLTSDEMTNVTLETIERNLPALEDFDFQIMHNVTRGGLDVYSELVKEGTSPVVTINVLPLVRHIGQLAKLYEIGAHFITPRQQSVPARFIDPKAKNRSRIYYKIAEIEAGQLSKGAMALLTDERGFVTEGTGNNFFMVKDGAIFTPKPHDILRGVSRQYCIELAQELGIPVYENDISPYDIHEADEAWYTSTTICMVPITKYHFQPIGTGLVGSIYRRLLSAWSEKVDVDIAGQAKKYSLMPNWRP